jgi:hypothetical protein
MPDLSLRARRALYTPPGPKRAGLCCANRFRVTRTSGCLFVWRPAA